MIRRVLKELKEHAPFTVTGAFTGIFFMLIFRKLPARISYTIFYTLHPIHIVLSALVTASMYEFCKCSRARKECNIWILLFIGYTGSVGIATLSDSLIPYLGEWLLRMPGKEAHIGFIEKWWLINPLAIIGIAIAYWRPSTKFPHFGHVLLSTWASLFHIMMARPDNLSWISYGVIFLFLFMAVWLPCCISDIVFPLLFVKEELRQGKDMK